MAEGDEHEVLDAVVTEMIDVIMHHDALSKVATSFEKS